MQVKIISETIQEFDGVRYYLCGYYFQNNGKRLHRAVWERNNGDIPSGYHIHHKDGDRSNNQLQNLELIYGKNHIQRHSSEPDRAGISRESIRIARLSASKWHSSDKGLEWHKYHYKKNCEKALKATFKSNCFYCKSEFDAKINGNIFCSNKCRAAHRRLLGVDNIKRSCIACGKEFTSNKYKKQLACSKKCGGEVGGNARRGMRQNRASRQG